MSTSDLYILNGKSTTHFASFRNGWGSGPVVWDHLGDKYISERPVYSLQGDHLKKVWALAGDKRLQPHERAVLMMTFDRAFVPLHGLAAASEACAKFADDTAHLTTVNHWQEIGEALARAEKTSLGRHARGLVLACTSVSDPWGNPSKDYLENAWPIYQQAEA